MSTNYDMIATVDIDIVNPVVDVNSFDHLLLVGPLPKTPGDEMPQEIGIYTSLTQVTDLGWAATGANADPIGIAARIAFDHKPSSIYIAPQQPTASAVKAKAAMAETKAVIAEKVGKKDNLTGCTLEVGPNVVTVNLTGPVSKVKNTGLFETLSALQEKGYTVSVNGTIISDAAGFKALSVFEEIAALTPGSAPVQFVVTATNSEGTAVKYGAIVNYPNAKASGEYVALEFTADDLDNGADAVESALTTIQKALATNGWYVVCPVGVDPAEYQEIAEYIETQEKLFCYTEFGGLGDAPLTVPNADELFRTLAIYGREYSAEADTDIPDVNKYLNVAFTAKWLNYPSGSETAAFKVLKDVKPSAFTAKEMRKLENSNVNFFITVGSKNVTMNGKVLGGEWADIIRFRDWLKNDMQVRVVNLFTDTPKVPYTDSGIALIQNAMLASLKAGQNVGGIAQSEYADDGTEIPGYITYVPTAASIPAAVKATRKLTGCTFAAKLEGAIHFAELHGSLTYEL